MLNRPSGQSVAGDTFYDGCEFQIKDCSLVPLEKRLNCEIAIVRWPKEVKFHDA